MPNKISFIVGHNIKNKKITRNQFEGTEKVPFGIKDLKNYLKTIF